MENNELVKKISDSKKYKDLSYKTVENIAISNSYSDDRTRSKLHQVWGAYYSARPNFEKLKKKYKDNSISLENILVIHSSTKERFIEFREIFEHIFSIIPRNAFVLDLGCGLNPLFQLLLNFKIKEYLAIDIDIAQQDFLNFVFKNENRNEFKTEVGDALIDSFKPVDAIFAFKLLPVLDQIDKVKTDIFLSNLKCEYFVISFPNKSLGGKEKGMKNNYKEIYIPRIERNNFKLIDSKEFKNESIYIFQKS